MINKVLLSSDQLLQGLLPVTLVAHMTQNISTGSRQDKPNMGKLPTEQ